MRTKKEIKSKIKELSNDRKTLPQYSMFGTNNWKTLDKELEILKSNLTETQVKKALNKMIDYYEGNFPEDETEKTKMDTYDWLLGNRDY